MQPQSPTPVSALQLLELFTARKIALTRNQYDEYFDSVLAALEAANNETFRLSEPPKEVR